AHLRRSPGRAAGPYANPHGPCQRALWIPTPHDRPRAFSQRPFRGVSVTGYLLRRLGHALATIFVAVTLVFLAMRALPGNPLLARFGQHPDPNQMEWLEKQYGWDQPIYVQLGTFYWRLIRYGDLGYSI